jgi:hypothetical protein
MKSTDGCPGRFGRLHESASNWTNCFVTLDKNIAC